VIDVLTSYQMERHVQRERDERKDVLRKEVVASAEFQELWNRIKPRTTCRVEFDTDELVQRATSAVEAMQKIDQVEVTFTTAELQVTRGGVRGQERAACTERIAYRGVTAPPIRAPSSALLTAAPLACEYFCSALATHCWWAGDPLFGAPQ